LEDEDYATDTRLKKKQSNDAHLQDNKTEDEESEDDINVTCTGA
jgi:hypothetical protein